MTLGELRSQLTRQLEEVIGAPVFFSVADLDDALNEGYIEISDASEWYEIWQTIDVLSNRPYYDLRTVFDREILTPGRAYNENTSRWLIPASAGDLDVRYRRWELIRSVPEQCIVRGLWWLGYWPMTAGEGTMTIKQYATALPDLLVADDDEPGFNEVYHAGLIEYAKAVLLPQQGEVTAALEAWSRYLEYEAALTASMNERGLVPQVQGYVANTRYAGR